MILSFRARLLLLEWKSRINNIRLKNSNRLLHHNNDSLSKISSSSSLSIESLNKKENDTPPPPPVIINTTRSSSSSSSSSLLSSKPVTTTTIVKNYDDDHNNNPTKLVDQLLNETNEYLNNTILNTIKNNSTKNDHRNHQLHYYHQHTIAYSGGVDSSLVAAILFLCNGNGNVRYYNTNHTISIQAILGISAAVSKEQILLAEKVANNIGITFHTIPTTEGQDEMYIANSGQACYACKTNLYSTLKAISNHQQQNSNNNNNNTASSSSTLYNNVNNNYREAHECTIVNINNQHYLSSSNHYYQYLYNGTNADDITDTTRVGLIAANEFHVISPIKHYNKEQIRIIAKHIQLPNWNYASNPCLRSRLQLGVSATSNHLHRVELAERYVRDHMVQYYNDNNDKQQQQDEDVITTTSITTPLFNEASNLRVRLLSDNRACIEIDIVHIDIVSNHIDWNQHFIQTLQFDSVIIRPFKSGSVSK